MAAAKPLDMSTSKPQRALAAGNTATGAPGVAGGYVPSGAVDTASSQAASAPGKTSTAVTPADGGYPGPNDTWNWIGKQKFFPVSAVGKLFFTEPGGPFQCSAAATFGNSSELDMVWTAGHCVGPHGGQSYYTNFLFCPEYKNGENPAVGCWNWAQAQQTGGWYFNGYWSADYAYLYMAPNSDRVNNHVVSVTGGLGLAWNWARDQHWIDLGYPAASPYTGGLLVATGAEHRYDVANPGGDPGAADNSIGSSQTPGFSGGPWIFRFASGGGFINSVNSYYFTSGPNGNEYGAEIQGPYFDSNACNFWKGGSGYTGGC